MQHYIIHYNYYYYYYMMSRLFTVPAAGSLGYFLRHESFDSRACAIFALMI